MNEFLNHKHVYVKREIIGILYQVSLMKKPVSTDTKQKIIYNIISTCLKITSYTMVEPSSLESAEWSSSKVARSFGSLAQQLIMT